MGACRVHSSLWPVRAAWIASDAVAAYRADLHQAALESLELSGALLATTAELIASWK